MVESANEHIRVSGETKERLRRRKRVDESFNDVITREAVRGRLSVELYREP